MNERSELDDGVDVHSAIGVGVMVSDALDEVRGKLCAECLDQGGEDILGAAETVSWHIADAIASNEAMTLVVSVRKDEGGETYVTVEQQDVVAVH